MRYMPGYESAAKGPIIPYKQGDETLYLHSWNSRVVCYEAPHEGMSHVEHWADGPGKTRRVWDINLIKTLQEYNFMSYLIKEPRDPLVLDEYSRTRQAFIDSIDLSDLVNSEMIDKEWEDFAA